MDLVTRIYQLLTPRRVALVTALAAMAIIGTALFFEHVMGILPCDLCLRQRIPYYIAIPIALVTACLPNGSRAIRIGLMILALLFLVNAGQAAFHSGVEWKWWPGPVGCSGSSAVTGSVEGLLAGMQQTTVVSCSEASWRLFGLSFAGWNVLASLGLTLFVLVPFRRARTTS